MGHNDIILLRNRFDHEIRRIANIGHAPEENRAE